ncbi:unnamed protein product [marine sediment metagenome]|uniref:Uncharacterized protein n=1 Tax=marine sediment metagenome TaxID=412755 RepID=X1DI61_9ZZZZ
MFEYRYIAGDHSKNVSIKYRSHIHNASLRVTSPRGENTSYSTRVNITGRLYTFGLPSNAPLGEWNVTLFANETHYTSFNIIAEENNFITFGKHTYNDNEPFDLLLKHSYYVGIIFYKDGVAQGSTWKIPQGQHTFELDLEVPYQYVTPTVGTWTVELWRLNFEVTQYVLSSHTCTVVDAPYSLTGGTGGFFVLLHTWQMFLILP